MRIEVLQIKDPDAEIVRRISSGDESALCSLYDCYHSIVFGLLIKILKNRAEAEEVLQDVFVQVWRSAANFDERRGRAFTWLIMIARSRAIDRLRSNASRAQAIEHLSSEPPPGPSSNAMDNVLHDERRRFVTAALEELPENQRNVLLMSYFEGFSQLEIAALTNTPLGTVKSQMQEGLMKLRKIINPTASV